MKSWEIALAIVLLLILMVFWAFFARVVYGALTMIIQRIKIACMQPGTAQVIAFRVSTHDPEDRLYDDARPVVELELNCEVKGKHFHLTLEPLTSQNLFKALELPEHSASCWMSDSDWHQLLDGRWIAIACNPRNEKAVLIEQLHYSREVVTFWLIASAGLVTTVLLAWYA
ncbi:MAG: hypothetical protein ACN6P1_11400 [Pseudomonas sp.]|uniref:hypothetical protein n=1 Tax=Pseudomonas sp. TaxID=306 RepID=UPI003D0E9E74